MRNPKLREIVVRAAFLVVLSAIYVGNARSQTPAVPSEAPLVLRGGLLIDGRGGAPIPNAVVVMEGAKIVAVGREGEVAVPANATVINTTGKTIIPGLVDSHVHMQNYFGPTYLYWGVTTVGDCGNEPQPWILAEKDAVAKGKVLGPTIMAAIALNPLTPSPANLDAPFDPWQYGDRGVGLDTFGRGNVNRRVFVDAKSPEAEKFMAATIAEAKQEGFDVIKLFGGPKLLSFIVEKAHAQGMPVFVHTQVGENRIGTDLIAETPVDMNVHLRAVLFPDDATDKALAQKLIANHVYLNPTVSYEGWEPFSKYREELKRDNLAALNGPLSSIVPKEDRDVYARAYLPYTGKDAAKVKEEFAKTNQFIRIFAGMGGKVVAGSDVNSTNSPGMYLHGEMQMLSELGLTPMQVLQAGTLWGMEAWHKEKEAGSIEVGKRADVVVLNRNPLDDISYTRDINAVIKNGKVVDRESWAGWKDPFPRPSPFDRDIPSTLIHLPMVKQLSPPSLAANATMIPEVVITGSGFTAESRVLLNGQFVTTKFYDSGKLGIAIDASALKKPGSYSLAVVQPGSGGGVSNLWFFIVSFPDGQGQFEAKR